MNEQWNELKETIIELRDNNGTGTQQEVCKFLANYMNVLEKQMSNQENQNMWIPVSEESPKEGQRVWATHLGGLDPRKQVIEHIYSDGKFLLNWYMDTDSFSPTFGQRYMGEIIAWMPCPKPYEEVEE